MYEGEVLLRRKSRAALMRDLEAVADFLERRAEMRERAGADAVTQAEQILREAA